MQAGRLRHLVTLQSPLRTQSIEDGELVESWVDEIEDYPAEVLELKGREYINSRELHAEVDVKVNMRYYPGLKPTWRIVFGDRLFQIKHVIDHQGRRRDLSLMCLEVVT